MKRCSPAIASASSSAARSTSCTGSSNTSTVTVTGAPGEPPQPRNAAFKLWYGVPTTITPDSVVEQAFMDATITRVLRAFGVAEHLTVNVIGPFESPAFDKAMLTALTEREQHTKPGAG